MTRTHANVLTVLVAIIAAVLVWHLEISPLVAEYKVKQYCQSLDGIGKSVCEGMRK